MGSQRGRRDEEAAEPTSDRRLRVYASVMSTVILNLALEATDLTLPKLIVLSLSNLTTLQVLETSGYYLPSVLGVLFFISNYSTAHDLSTLLLSTLLVVNNLINSGLVAFLNVSRPDPFLDPGQPARPVQTLFFFVTFYAVYARFWAEGRSWKGLLTLFIAIVWSSSVYIANGYYTWSQVFGGAFVGTAFGVASANWARLVIIPHAHVYVLNWNQTVDNWWWTFGLLHVAHAYHWHPGHECNEKGCKGAYRYSIVPIIPSTANVDFGASLLFHTFMKILVYILIHFNT